MYIGSFLWVHHSEEDRPEREGRTYQPAPVRKRVYAPCVRPLCTFFARTPPVSTLADAHISIWFARPSMWFPAFARGLPITLPPCFYCGISTAIGIFSALCTMLQYHPIQKSGASRVTAVAEYMFGGKF